MRKLIARIVYRLLRPELDELAGAGIGVLEKQLAIQQEQLDHLTKQGPLLAKAVAGAVSGRVGGPGVYQ